MLYNGHLASGNWCITTLATTKLHRGDEGSTRWARRNVLHALQPVEIVLHVAQIWQWL
jgi:hypothetical protein